METFKSINPTTQLSYNTRNLNQNFNKMKTHAAL